MSDSLSDESSSLNAALFLLSIVPICARRALELAGLSPILSPFKSATFTFLLINSRIVLATFEFCRISANLTRTSARIFSMADFSCARESVMRYVYTSSPIITNSIGASLLGLWNVFLNARTSSPKTRKVSKISLRNRGGTGSVSCSHFSSCCAPGIAALGLSIR